MAVIDICLFLVVPWVCLWSVIVSFSGHTFLPFNNHLDDITVIKSWNLENIINFYKNTRSGFTLMTVLRYYCEIILSVMAL